jgi:hypothetical protein
MAALRRSCSSTSLARGKSLANMQAFLALGKESARGAPDRGPARGRSRPTLVRQGRHDDAQLGGASHDGRAWTRRSRPAWKMARPRPTPPAGPPSWARRCTCSLRTTSSGGDVLQQGERLVVTSEAAPVVSRCGDALRREYTRPHRSCEPAEGKPAAAWYGTRAARRRSHCRGNKRVRGLAEGAGQRRPRRHGSRLVRRQRRDACQSGWHVGRPPGRARLYGAQSRADSSARWATPRWG